MSKSQALYPRIIYLAKRLLAAGHNRHAHQLRKALLALSDNLEDESDGAPDWRPLLYRVRELELEGLALLGETP